MVLDDLDGRRRAEILGLEAQFYPSLAVDRTARTIESQAKWNQGVCPWDSSGATTKQQLRSLLDLDQYLDPNKEWTAADLKDSADLIRQNSRNVKLVLNFTVKPEMSDVQVVHQLLSQLGAKVGRKWSRSHPGFEGQKIRVYRLDADCWRQAWEVLERRREHREWLANQTEDD